MGEKNNSDKRETQGGGLSDAVHSLTHSLNSCTLLRNNGGPITKGISSKKMDNNEKGVN